MHYLVLRITKEIGGVRRSLMSFDVEKRNSTLIFLADQENATAGASEDLGAITIDEWKF